jgi:hypothetical protein
MINLLSTKKDTGKSQKVREIKAWTADILRLDEDVGLMVSELQCTEPGCPPIETVIAVLRPNGEKTQFKIHLALSEVTREDVAQKLGNTKKGDQTHDCSE